MINYSKLSLDSNYWVQPVKLESHYIWALCIKTPSYYEEYDFDSVKEAFAEYDRLKEYIQNL